MQPTNLINHDEIAVQLIRQKVATIKAQIAEKQEEIALYELILNITSPKPGVPGIITTDTAKNPPLPKKEAKRSRRPRAKPVMDAMLRLNKPVTVSEIADELAKMDAESNPDSGREEGLPGIVSLTVYRLEIEGKVKKEGKFGSYHYSLAQQEENSTHS